MEEPTTDATPEHPDRKTDDAKQANSMVLGIAFALPAALLVGSRRRPTANE